MRHFFIGIRSLSRDPRSAAQAHRMRPRQTLTRASLRSLVCIRSLSRDPRSPAQAHRMRLRQTLTRASLRSLVWLFLSCFLVGSASAEEYYTNYVSEDANSEPHQHYGESLESMQKRTEKARKLWLSSKDKHKDSYSYERGFASWVGFGFQTKVVVENGVATERSYHAFDREGTVTESWQESGDELGSHGAGFAAKTIDELYEECATVVLTQNPDENWIGVSFGKDGELISCSYFPMNCADDCSEGLGHLNFTWKP